MIGIIPDSNFYFFTFFPSTYKVKNELIFKQVQFLLCNIFLLLFAATVNLCLLIFFLCSNFIPLNILKVFYVCNKVFVVSSNLPSEKEIFKMSDNRAVFLTCLFSAGTNNKCQAASCECDRVAAHCFAQNKYNSENKNLDHKVHCANWDPQPSKKHSGERCISVQHLISSSFSNKPWF